MSDSIVLFERINGVAVITLNAPPRNELNGRMFTALGAICRGPLAAHDYDGVIVRGAGRHFSSGADTEELRRLVGASGGDAPFLRENIETFLALERCRVPVVAAIGGCCLGAGLELALACHYRIATTHAVLGLPESTFGLIPGCGGTVRLAALAGRAVAARMILGGQTMDSSAALATGLIDMIVDKKELAVAASAAVVRLRNRGGVRAAETHA